MNRLARSLVILGFAVLPFSQAFATAALADDGTDPTTDVAGVTVSAPAATGIEQALLDATNTDRRNNGLAPVSFDPSLLDIARQRAAAQLGAPSLNHFDASGNLAFVGLLADAGVDYSLAGENLARSNGTMDPAMIGRIEAALMQSPTHRKNILEPSFNDLAIGVAMNDSGQVVFAEIYRTSPDGM